MHLTSLHKRANEAIDRLVGATELGPAQHDAIAAARVATITRHIPIMSISGVAASLLLVFASWGQNNLPLLTAWIAGYLIVQSIAMRAWWRSRTRSNRVDDRGLTAKAFIYAAVLGVFWGGLVGILISDIANDQIVLVAALVTAGFLISAFSFAAFVQPMLVFIIASGTIAGGAFLFLPGPHQAVPMAILMLFYIVFLPWIGVGYAREFLSRVASDIQNQENAEVIGYLLNEYEETISEWFWEVDNEGRALRMSTRLSDKLGISASVIKGFDFWALITQVASGEQEGLEEIRQATKAGQGFKAIELQVTVEGEERWWRISGKPSVGNPRGRFIGTVCDVTSEKHAKSQIIQLAHRDTLTGLFNRASFTERLDLSVRTLERFGTPFTLLFLDLDKFKLVNDTYGHPVGDKLLAEVARRINSTVREEDCVARLGGDEFAIILEQSNDAVFAAKLASRLIAKVLEPYSIDDETLWIGVSVGIALAPQHGTRPEQILRNADLALYRAKEDGRGVFRYFEAQMDFAQRERRVLEQEMHQALEEDEFRLCYQPMISAKTGRIAAMEALIRWDHPIRGEISPLEFISIAEQSNLIVEIGKWTLRAACEAAQAWPDNICVAVNVAATHFMRSDIVGDIKSVLTSTGLPPERLEIEITESLLIDDSDDVTAKLIALKELGCWVVMDDFGTGYSSLSYLLKFPFDRLKIDRSFVTDMNECGSAKAILLAVASLGDNLNIKITAEGVETTAQRDFLVDIGCDQLQGYLFSHPLRHEEVAAVLLRNFMLVEQIDAPASTVESAAPIRLSSAH